jgi:hypothetical protein
MCAFQRGALTRTCMQAPVLAACNAVQPWSGRGSSVTDASCAPVPWRDHPQIKAALLGWMQRDCAADTSSPPGFLRNKLAQALVVLVQLQYPGTWPTFFHDMVAAAATGPGLADMFVRILASVDEDVISLEFARWVPWGSSSVLCVATVVTRLPAWPPWPCCCSARAVLCTECWHQQRRHNSSGMVAAVGPAVRQPGTGS